MLTITNKASSMTKKMKPRVKEYVLGTEYVKLETDGINTMLGEYSIVFQDTPSNIYTLENKLTSLNGTAQFMWNPYADLVVGSVAKAFLCEEWDVSDEMDGKSTLSATFKEQPLA